MHRPFLAAKAECESHEFWRPCCIRIHAADMSRGDLSYQGAGYAGAQITSSVTCWVLTSMCESQQVKLDLCLPSEMPNSTMLINIH